MSMKRSSTEQPTQNIRVNSNNALDTISRQAAIDGFYEMASDMEHLCTVSDYVSFLESLQPEPRWIPVSERLPEDDDIVLITMDDSITVRGEFFEQISNELGFFKEGVWHWGYEIGECYWPETTHVTAWMPLPEPYKENE